MASRGKTSKSPESADRVAVLVVDDDADICVAVEMLLDYEGFEVWTANNGKQALQRIEKEAESGRSPGVVLTDVKMPEMDGITLLERIRERPGPPPVIMISGHGDITTAVEAVKAGAVDFLEKPLEQNRVLVSLNQALRQNRLEQENSGLRRQLSERWQIVG